MVKIAQMDKTISFPPELDIPWTHLQQKFGLTSDGGNLTSNMLYNVNQQGKVVYEINGVMSDVIRQSEQNFANTFRITEVHVSIFQFSGFTVQFNVLIKPSRAAKSTETWLKPLLHLTTEPSCNVCTTWKALRNTYDLCCTISSAS